MARDPTCPARCIRCARRLTSGRTCIRAAEYTARPCGEARQDEEALLQERPALQEVPGRVQAPGEAGAGRAPRAARLPGLGERLEEAAQGRSRPLSGAGAALRTRPPPA